MMKGVRHANHPANEHYPLPNDMADVVKTKVRPGEYASEAERRRAMDDLVAQAQEIGMGYD